MKQPQSLMGVVSKVLIPLALAHLISYLFRTVNAVVYPDLSSELGLAAADLGLLTSSYFFMFALAQLPIGVALDRYGPRKVQVPMLLIAAAGAILFSYADTLTELAVARGMIGLGVAASLMSSMKGSSLWFAPKRLPLIFAIILAVGGIGMMISTVPMQIAMQHIGWREAFFGLGIATFLVSALIFFVVPERPRDEHKTIHLKIMIREVGELFSTSTFWKMCLYTLFANAGFMSVIGLWMGPWLKDVAHLNAGDASYALLAGAIAMFSGSLAFGWITDHLQKFRFKPILICGGGICIFILFQLLMISGLNINPFFIVIGFSFFGTAAGMNYAIILRSVPSHLAGRVATSFNLIVFIVAFLIQWGMGKIIDLWEPINGIYPEVAYQYAIGIVLALQIPGLLLWLTFKPWVREPDSSATSLETKTVG